MRHTIERMAWTGSLILFWLAEGHAQVPGSELAQADSIVLERTRCYGTCPAYRLRLSATGEVLFRSIEPMDEIHSDTMSADEFAHLLAMARRIGFYDLPDRVDEGDVRWCPDYATDHPTYIGSIYSGSTHKQVVYYTGCYTGRGEHTVAESLERLQDFLAAIDSLAGSSRWIRPTPFF